MGYTVDGATYYRLYSSSTESGTYTEITAAAGAGTTYNDTLPSNTARFYKVRACADNSGVDTCSDLSDAASATTQLPAMPDAPTVTANGATEIGISWSTVVGATYYRLFSSSTENGTYSEITAAAGTGTAYTHTVPSNTTLFYRVRACADNSDVGTCSALSDAASAKTELPGIPTGLAATANGATEIGISWDAVDGATYYRLERSTTADSGYAQVAGVSGVTYTDTARLSNTEYFYKVRACADNSAVGTCSNPSDAASATTGLPAQPDAPTATAASAISIMVSWATVDGATYYRLYSSSTEGGTYTEIDAAAGAGTTHTHTPLPSNTEYFYKVRACADDSSEATCSVLSDAVGATTQKPAAPAIPTATASSSFSIDITWGEPDGANYYRLYSALSSGGPYSQISEGAAAQYAHTGLTANTPYFYQVRACADGSGEDTCSAPSASGSATTLPAAPATLTATARSATEIDLSWSSASGAAWYRIYSSDAENGDYAQITGAARAGTAYTHTGLLSNTEYFYKVTACADDSGEATCSGFSDFANAMTPVPAMPGRPSATASSDTEISLAWDAINGATHYRLYSSATSGGVYSQIFEGAALVYSHSSLMANTTYYYRLAACADDSDTGACSDQSPVSSATTLLVTPPAPAAVVQGSYRIDLSWNMADDAGHYRLYRALNDSAPGTQIHEGNVLAYSDTGLTGNTTYYYRLAACVDTDPATCSARSEPANAQTAPAAPVVEATVSGTTIELTWEVIGGATYYEIWRGTHAGGIDRALITGDGLQPHPTAASYSDEDTDEAITWYYWSRACDSTRPICSDFSQASEPVVYTRSVRLNDTGILFAANTTGANSVDCTSDITPAQDCAQGRDALAAAGTLSKVGQGVGGLDFTRLGSDGGQLAAQNGTWAADGDEQVGTHWSCVRDNHTGLVWEVKTDDDGIHDKDTTYQWGGIGSEGRGSSDGSRGTYLADDDANGWDRLVNGSNSESLCGLTNWRVPTVRELASIARVNSNPAIATGHFPNTTGSNFWSVTPRSINPDNAMMITFNGGIVMNPARTTAAAVRLVSGAYESASADAVTAAGGQTHRPWAANHTPDDRYMANTTNNTVIDTETGLMWQQCAAGLTGTNCATGTADMRTWQAALGHAASSTFAGFDDWRLPNLAELRSIVAYDRHAPAINASVFPATGEWPTGPPRPIREMTAPWGSISIAARIHGIPALPSIGCVWYVIATQLPRPPLPGR